MLVEAQNEFGKLTKEDIYFKVFEKDTTAEAVYLYESGNNFFEVRGDYVWLITQYHAKIKILKEKGLDKANIEIPYYHNKRTSEKVLKIKAITHNNGRRNYLPENKIFNIDTDERWSEKRFTFSDVQVGSILEYSYEVQSPFFFNLNGWQFQSDIPKVFTEYRAKIPGNWFYNRTLNGELELDVNDATLQKNCFTIPRAKEMASCEVLHYTMKNVPAFKDEEEFMLAGSNYRSSLEFELSEYQRFDGRTEKYTQTWKDVDKKFQKNQDIGRQLRKKNFFEKNVPIDLFDGENALHKAQKIYKFVQNHFSWNKKYGIWQDNKVKKAFDEKKGNVFEINMSLINLLNAAGLDAKMMLTATRRRGLPKKSHPVMSDFNYTLAKVDIDGQDYLLDATEEYLPFGMLPYRCLNYYGRVMDFEKESYWYDIIPEQQNRWLIRAQMKLDQESKSANGRFKSVSFGYKSLEIRQKLNSLTEEGYLSELEEGTFGDFYITEHEVVNSQSHEKQLTQDFEFEVENVFQDRKIFLNPFVIQFFDRNPFLVPERYYPIDFGYKRNYMYTLNIEIPKDFKIASLPEKIAVSLPDDSGTLRFECVSNDKGILNVFFDFRLDYTQYSSGAYKIIKEFFQYAVNAQTKSYIVLEKS